MTELIHLAEAYRCPHCRKLYQLRYAAEKHARHCLRNPDRRPCEGEITRSDSWWVDEKTMAAWHPGKAGMVFFKGEWRDIPGYSEGCGWPVVGHRGEYDGPDFIPYMGEEITFDRCSRSMRVEMMEALKAANWDGELGWDPHQERAYVG